jgi:hypothetical protein
MKYVEISLFELGERKNCWFRDYAILIEEGKGQIFLFTFYPDWKPMNKKYLIYQFYFN